MKFIFICFFLSFNLFSNSVLPNLKKLAEELYQTGSDNNYIYSLLITENYLKQKIDASKMELLEEGEDEIELSLAECVFMPKGVYDYHVKAEVSLMMARAILKRINFNNLKVIRINEEKIFDADGIFSATCALAFQEGKNILVMQAQAMD